MTTIGKKIKWHRFLFEYVRTTGKPDFLEVKCRIPRKNHGNGTESAAKYVKAAC